MPLKGDKVSSFTQRTILESKKDETNNYARIIGKMGTVMGKLTHHLSGKILADF